MLIHQAMPEMFPVNVNGSLTMEDPLNASGMDPGNNWKLMGIIADTNLNSTGNAGNITVTAGSLNIFDDAAIDATTYAPGNAGTINVTANSLLIDNHSITTGFAGIFSSALTQNSGYAGTVNVQAGNAEIRDGGQITSLNYSSGGGGNIYVNVTGSLTLEDPAFAPNVTGIGSTTVNSSGNAGKVTVQTGTLNIFDDAEIDTSTILSTNVNGNTIDLGNAGVIEVTTNTLLIDSHASQYSGGIFSIVSTNASGNAGTIVVHGQNAELSNGGQISTGTYSSGKGGDIFVTVTGTLSLDDPNSAPQTTEITSNTQSTGDAGNVTIQASMLNIFDDAQISSSTSATGKAGAIDVSAGTLLIDSHANPNSAGIFSNSSGTQSSGQIGDINIDVSSLFSLMNNAQISISNNAVVSDHTQLKAIIPGNITISAQEIRMIDSTITSAASGNVPAGGINIDFSHALTLNFSSITTSANTGNGGPITINGGNGYLDLVNSGISTSVAGANGNGGNIQLTAGVLVMDTAEIQANAFSGAGGNIALNLNDLLSSGDALIEGGAPIAWNPP